MIPRNKGDKPIDRSIWKDLSMEELEKLYESPASSKGTRVAMRRYMNERTRPYKGHTPAQARATAVNFSRMTLLAAIAQLRVAADRIYKEAALSETPVSWDVRALASSMHYMTKPMQELCDRMVKIYPAKPRTRKRNKWWEVGGADIDALIANQPPDQGPVKD